MDLYFLGLLMISFLGSVFLTKFIIKKMANIKYGYDLHKKNKDKVSEMGGISPVIISSSIISLFNPAISILIMLSGFVGVIDDISRLNAREKITLTFLMGLPTVLLLQLSIIPSILLLFGIFLSSNFTNMLAGFNGLEIGLGIILCFFMAAILFINGDITGFKIVSLFLVSYLGLLYYNKFPARVFPGDTGTLPIGAFLATIAVSRGFIIEFGILMFPYVIDAFLKQVTAGVTKKDEVYTPTTIGKEGKLHVKSGYLSLPRLILKRKPMNECKIVVVLWLIGVFFGILSMAYTIYIDFKIFA
ncbi:glycosyl transferase family 4 [Methanococcus vannielii SB]|uniref:Glycosyl transferase family 4 n=1 Tax=Methanococcus vannielii (strain ATCC 35089 / DSM 1224 / JCM 13029 / OCM 148 / SB) TaxID=406327 RepID=A6UQ68_METVS|nr:glycosyltransferase 4 family protein [Methanococcus vannielii]ABR54640.1 glycosyl transferase family 4 [Methanococcus vannielii SB]